jgi:hypothetical protein
MKQGLIVFAAAATCVLTACSSSVSGSGEGAPSASSSPAPSSSASTSSPAPSSSVASSAPAPNPITTSPVHTTTSSAPSTGSPSSAVAGPADMHTVSYTVSCSSHADTGGTVKLSWTASGADSVYVLEAPIASALVGADAKSQGGTGPLPAQGSTTMPFACAADDDYYLVEAYNSGDSSHSGVVQQVPFS